MEGCADEETPDEDWGGGLNDAQAILADHETRSVEASHLAEGDGAGREVRVEAIQEARQGTKAPVRGRH